MSDKVAIITGAGRGIGRTIALCFAKAGINLLLSSRTLSELDNVAEECRKSGVVAKTAVGDVSNFEDCRKIFTMALSINSRIDILVNNAGVYGPLGSVGQIDSTEWVNAIGTNLFGVFFMTNLVLPEMKKQKYGKIINLSGGGATNALPNFSAYAASKAAVARLTDTIAEEVRDYNIQVNTIAPGLVDTQLQDSILTPNSGAGQEMINRMSKVRKTGLGAVPPELASDLCLFLVSDASQKLTGKLISAPHDPWKKWQNNEKLLDEVANSELFTIKRVDPYTINPLIEKGLLGKST